MYKKDYIQREKDGCTTWVRKDLDGKEDEYSACMKCADNRHGDEFNNCGHLNSMRELLEAWGIVAVVWSCPYRSIIKQEGWTCNSCGAVNSDDNVLCSYCATEKGGL